MKNNKNPEVKPFEVCLYFKIFGLAIDENEQKEYAYAKIELGKSMVEIPYSELIELIDLSKVASTLGCAESDITVITKKEFEERDRNYESR